MVGQSDLYGVVLCGIGCVGNTLELKLVVSC